MIVTYIGGGRDFDRVEAVFGEYSKFANKTVRLKGWLYRDEGRTFGGGGLPLPQNSEKPTFYFETSNYIYDKPMYWVLGKYDGKTHLSEIIDNAMVKELSSCLISESMNSDSNYYLEEIQGYYGL